MSSDPYKILGVAPNADDEEIKAAYRALAKKYHPDLHPGDECAAQRMNEINAAYDQLKNPQTQPGNWGAAAYQTQSDTERNELKAARNLIRARQFAQALTALSGVPQGQRDGEWYYLHSLASCYMDRRMAALDSARRACTMSPGNMQYRQLLQQLESGARFYDEMGSSFGFQSMNLDGGKWCLSMFLANLLCNMFGRSFFCC